MDAALTLAQQRLVCRDVTYVVVDVETTGLRADVDRIVSLAMVFCDADGEICGSWYTLVDAGVDPGPTHVHGITSSMLEGAPDFAAIAPAVGEALSGLTFVAHNAAFDWGFLSREFERCGIEIVKAERLCTLVLARSMRLDVSSYSLVSLGEYFGLESWQAHNALADAIACAGLLHQLLARQR
jgi:DNA polymerase-3 subunit epsilon